MDSVHLLEYLHFKASLCDVLSELMSQLKGHRSKQHFILRTHCEHSKGLPHLDKNALSADEAAILTPDEE